MNRLFLGLCLCLFGSILLYQQGVTFWIDVVLKDVAQRNTLNMVKGPIHVMRLDMAGLTAEQARERLALLQPHFGFPLLMTPLDELPAEMRERLMLGEVLITPLSGSADHHSAHFLLEDTDGVVTLGPFTQIPELESLSIWTDYVGILAGALGVLIWLLLLRSRLGKVAGAADRFGAGELAARVGMRGKDLIARLASRFDAMAQRIQQLVESQKHLINAASHELRTPIARMRFALEMIDTPQDSRENQYLESLSMDIAELDDLVNELLSYARLDGIPADMAPEKSEIATWLTGIVDGWRSPLPMASEYRIPPELADWRVAFHGDYLARALGNILVNAARYGASKVCVGLERHKDICAIYVDDDGPGIPKDRRERLFSPFVRLEESRSRESGGSGMGLAIVARIMSLHGGEAVIEDSPLGGARLVLRWPDRIDGH